MTCCICMDVVLEREGFSERRFGILGKSLKTSLAYSDN